MKYLSVFLLCLFVTACSGSNYAPVRHGPGGQHSSQKAVYVPKNDFYKIPKQKQCVPHAREISGIQIYGDAHTWWHQAPGKGYKRSQVPQVGSVFVLSKTNRLKYGHVSVVKNVLSSRKIEVEHSNWGGTMDERCIVYKYMPVQDVSKNNDWTLVRFWNYPSKSFGSLYKGSGFIYPKETSKDLIVSQN